MAPPPGENLAGESTSGDSQRSIPTPFLTKTYQLVDDSSIDDVISWNEDGTAFIVWNTTEFARAVLPKYFKHNNFSSFVRQLNTYGFRKIVPDRWEFQNDCFRKGEKQLLRDIQRRKILSPAIAAQPVTVAIPSARLISPSNSGDEQVISSNSSPLAAPNLCQEMSLGSMAELMDENERLRRENQQMSKELSQMKSLCSNIYALMSNYGNINTQAADSGSGFLTVKPLDLLQRKRVSGENHGGATSGNSDGWVKAVEGESSSPKLFGVPIGMTGVKRAREENDCASAEHDDLLQLQQPGTDGMKSEPSDRDNRIDDDQEKPWLTQRHRVNQRVCN